MLIISENYIEYDQYYRVISMKHRSTKSYMKRSIDVLLSMILALLVLPVVFVAAVILLLVDGRPITFGQRRLGQNGRPFVCYKLRTMSKGADEQLRDLLAKDSNAKRTWDHTGKLPADPRIHPLGAWLRRTSLDELPQLWNVIKGEMSLVGPRPICGEERERYGDAIQQCYLPLRPGLTGAWQVSGRSNLSYKRRVACDLDYAANWSLRRDLVILLQTVPAVLTRDGAY